MDCTHQAAFLRQEERVQGVEGLKFRVFLCVYMPTGLWSRILRITSDLTGKRRPVLQITQGLGLYGSVCRLLLP